jgi:organic hydroperoxide reductase OsmC/OhrA
MHPYPHTYIASAAAESTGSVAVTAAGLPGFQTATPPEFDGPGGMWSPETLLCASIADCLILTFRSVARAARFEWLHLECRVEGMLDRVERVSQFTHCTSFVKLTVSAGANVAKGRELLERAEHGCLIANSLRGTRSLDTQVVVASR